MSLENLSLLEGNASVLYTALADRVTLHAVKTALMEVAVDSQKHSMLLRNLEEKMPKLKTRSNSNGKTEDAFNVTYAIYKDIIATEEISPEKLLALSEKLAVLEKILAEKYAFLLSKTRKLKENASDGEKNGGFDAFETLFTQLIKEDENHQKLLGALKELVERETSVGPEVYVASVAALVVSPKSR